MRKQHSTSRSWISCVQISKLPLEILVWKRKESTSPLRKVFWRCRQKRIIISNWTVTRWLRSRDLSSRLVSIRPPRRCLLALITHPGVLKMAQAELDALLPTTSSPTCPARSPTFADGPKLPHLNALVLEPLRWRPATPLGLMHASSATSIYEGYVIPAGTTIIASTWPLNHDPAFYPSPSTFEAARFLSPSDPHYDTELVGQEHPLKSSLSSFGWGRRACPGE